MILGTCNGSLKAGFDFDGRVVNGDCGDVDCGAISPSGSGGVD